MEQHVSLKKIGKFFLKFLLDVKTKKQAQALLGSLTPAQNSAVREIIYNVSRRYPNRYKRLAKKVHKPLSNHFFEKILGTIVEIFAGSLIFYFRASQ